jgi:hypothetical protein
MDFGFKSIFYIFVWCLPPSPRKLKKEENKQEKKIDKNEK